MTLEDIEDIIIPTATILARPKPKELSKSKNLTNADILKSPTHNATTTEPETNLPHGIPGTQKVHVKTWGCSHNNSDSEYMAGLLNAYGYTITDTGDEADLWLLNSCTVKGPSQEAFFNYIAKARASNKLLVLAGCVPQAQQNLKRFEGLSLVGVQQIDRIVYAVEETLKGREVRLFSTARKEIFDAAKNRSRLRKDGGAPLDMPKIRRNSLVEIVSINTGCLNACTYCKTKHARGDLGSYDADEIIDRIQSVIRDEGVREIWLTSEDLGAYGLDIGTHIGELLDRIVDILPLDVMLRLGMTNPPYILNRLETIARILNKPNVYSFIHVPVQCGSDSVLNHMKRTYTVKDFERVVDFLKERVPNVNIATDIICGYPSESEEDFDGTMRLCEKYKFTKLHISQFYPRPGTPAARMKKLPTHIVKSRSRRITKLFESYGYEQTYSAAHRPVTDIVFVVESATSNEGEEQWVGRNTSYQKVLVAKNRSGSLLGRFSKVRYVSSSKFYIKAEFIEFVDNMAFGEATQIAAENAVRADNAASNGPREVEAKSAEKKMFDVEDRVRLFWGLVMLCFFAIGWMHFSHKSAN